MKTDRFSQNYVYAKIQDAPSAVRFEPRFWLGHGDQVKDLNDESPLLESIFNAESTNGP